MEVVPAYSSRLLAATIWHFNFAGGLAQSSRLFFGGVGVEKWQTSWEDWNLG
jgi:hypothetical protein